MKVARGIAIKGVADLLVRVGSFLTFPIIARHLGASGYGAYGQVLTVIGLIVPFSTLGIGGAVVRFFSPRPWDTNSRRDVFRLLTVAVATSSVCGLIVTIAASELNRLLLHSSEGASLFRWGGLLVTASAMELLVFEFLRARHRLTNLSILQTTESASSLAAIGILVPAGYGLVTILQVSIAIKVVLSISVVAGFSTWDSPEGVVSPGEQLNLGSFVRFGLPLSVVGLGGWLMNFGDRLVLGYKSTAEILGVYVGVYSVASLLSSINGPLNLSLYPRMMHLIAKEGIDPLRTQLRTFHRFATLALVPSAAFLLVAMKPILAVMGGVAFNPSVTVGMMIVGAVFLDQWNSIAHYVLLCKDEVRFCQNMWLLMGAANVLANLWAIPAYGLPGAAFVTLATYVVVEVSFYFRARRHAPLDSTYRYDVGWKAVCASIFGSFFVLIEPPTRVVGLLVVATFFGLSYLIGMVLLREIGGADARDLMAFVRLNER